LIVAIFGRQAKFHFRANSGVAQMGQVGREGEGPSLAGDDAPANRLDGLDHAASTAKGRIRQTDHEAVGKGGW
jgi:hypothetical protein